jgi:hypothetical protein
MRDADVGAFYALLDDVGALLLRPGQVLSPTAKAMFFRALTAYDLATVRAALDAHVKDPQRGRFMPLPADLIAQIQGTAVDDGRPGAEEAWALALGARDEAATIVWTPEVAQAWDIARAVFEVGDEVGARMAFREAYTRLVDEARRERKRCEWTASLGFDAAARRDAIEQAVQLGRLPQEDLLALPAPITGASVAPGVLKVLQVLRDTIAKANQGPSQADLDRERTEQQKARADELVREYTAPDQRDEAA